MVKISRKDFLKNSVLASVALPFGTLGHRIDPKPLVVPETEEITTDEHFWNEVRLQYKLDEKVINFNNGSVGPQPLPVQVSHIKMYSQSNKAPAHFMWHELNDKRETLRQELAELIDAETEELAINRNTTEGLSAVIFGLNLKAGDEVVVSDFDYPFMLNAWRQRQMRDGIILKEVKLPLPIEDVDQAVELYSKAITSKTKVVHITHVINWTGQVMPVKEITAMAKEKGCEVVVDSAHALAHVPLSFKQIGCDYLATSLHKWLGAPFGTGALVIKKEKKASLWPLMSPYEPQSDDIKKFEFLGTRSIPAEMAALDAIEFHQKLGDENVHKRLHYIKNYWVEKVKDLDDVTVHTSLMPEFGGAMATFSVAGLKAGEIVTRLRETAYFDVGYVVWNGMDAVRISPHIYTTLEELDLLVVAIKKVVDR